MRTRSSPRRSAPTAETRDLRVEPARALRDVNPVREGHRDLELARELVLLDRGGNLGGDLLLDHQRFVEARRLA
jgi:hypothetical protein